MGKVSTNGASAKRANHPTRVLLIGDRFLLLDALRIGLSAEQMEVAAVGNTRQGVEDATSAFHPDVIVFDGSQSPAAVGMRAVRLLKETGRIVTAIAAQGVSVEAAQLVSAGADCVLGLDTGLEDLAKAINRCLAGESPMALDRRYTLEQLLRDHRSTERQRWLPFEELTRRERDIFALVYEGMSADQIADDACVSVSTVRSHIRNILNKLNVNSQLAAVAMARSNEWFSTDSLTAAG